MENKLLTQANSMGERDPALQATISRLVEDCCTVPHPKCTPKFLQVILKEMNDLASRETSQPKITVLKELLSDLSEYAKDLDCSEQDAYNKKDLEKFIGVISLDLKHSLRQLFAIDNRIEALRKRRTRILKRLESSFCPYLEFQSDKEENNDASYTDLKTQKTVYSSSPVKADDPSPNNDQYFDESVLSAAALSAQLQVPCKQESIMVVENSHYSVVNMLAEVWATHLIMNKDKLICGSNEGTLTRYLFKESILPYIPDRTSSANVCRGPFAQMLLWDDYIIVAAMNGSVFKCTLRCKVVKVFEINVGISCMDELKGVLYVCSVDGRLHMINARSFTLIKDALQLSYPVKAFKAVTHNFHTLIICLTAFGEIIGTSISDGVFGSLAFKFVQPSVMGQVSNGVNERTNVFHVEKANSESLSLVLYCRSNDSTVLLLLQAGTLSNRNIISFPSTALSKVNDLLLLGSSTGDVMVFNTVTLNANLYKNVVPHKVLTLAYQPSKLYIGTERGIFSLVIDSKFPRVTLEP